VLNREAELFLNNGLSRAYFFAIPAIDALVFVDFVNVAFFYAIDRTFRSTRATSNASISNKSWHNFLLLFAYILSQSTR
jgi:hypothetical protein